MFPDTNQVEVLPGIEKHKKNDKTRMKLNFKKQKLDVLWRFFTKSAPAVIAPTCWLLIANYWYNFNPFCCEDWCTLWHCILSSVSSLSCELLSFHCFLLLKEAKCSAFPEGSLILRSLKIKYYFQRHLLSPKLKIEIKKRKKCRGSVVLTVLKLSYSKLRLMGLSVGGYYWSYYSTW